MKESEEQLTNLGLSSLDLETTHETKNGDKFLIKSLLPFEKNYVVKLISTHGGNVSEVSDEEAEYVRKTCTLQVCVKDHPDWFNVSSCIDSELLDILYDKWQELEIKLKAKLKKNREAK